jgi:hypothetical protein
MEHYAEQTSLEVATTPMSAADVIKLIRKLRWIGLESEARELQDVLTQLPSPRSGSLVAGPHSTD